MYVYTHAYTYIDAFIARCLSRSVYSLISLMTLLFLCSQCVSPRCCGLLQPWGLGLCAGPGGAARTAMGHRRCRRGSRGGGVGA